MELWEKRFTKCDQLSGGEKRRLSVAQELAQEPKLMFFDEPTSGLDSDTASKVIAYFKTMVLEDTNKIIVCTIHQPSKTLFEKFDKVSFVL